MRLWRLSLLFLLSACASSPGETTVTERATTVATTAAIKEISSTASDNSFAKEESTPVVQTTKKPSGVYRFLLPCEKGKNLLHTIAFYSNTYRLQEEYPGKKDSVVVTQGTWAPSQGFIWLYKDQVLRGRYAWKGDTLQYFSPQLKQRFSLQKLEPVESNKVWQNKKSEGTLLYAVGNEPFWSIELTKADSLVLNMPDWNEPLHLPLSAIEVSKDSTVYTSATDSLRVTIYPYFCTDGMSDFLYSQKVKLVYRGQVYKGCGEVLQRD